MPYVITDPCISVCDTACVKVCPVDAIHGPRAGDPKPQLFIDPRTCIDCSMCEPECPVRAIFPDDSVPVEFQGAIRRNAEFFEGADMP